MDRRQFLSLTLATPLFSGCVANSPPEETILGKPIPPSRDTLETTQRPPAEEPPNATQETVSPQLYPTRPSTYDDESVNKFVAPHERAYRCNSLLDRYGSKLVSFDTMWDWTSTLATNGDVGVGRCQYTYSETVDDEDGTVIGDSPTIVVTYYVDDSMIVRAEDSGTVERRDELTPDPWETGVILEPSE